MSRIYNLLVKNIKYIEKKCEKEECTLSKRVLKDVLFDLHEIRRTIENSKKHK